MWLAVRAEPCGDIAMLRLRTNSGRALIFIGIFILMPCILGAQHIKHMEFRDQNITDILMALAQAADVSIVPDETVSGKASFFFADAEFDSALNSFLATAKLYSVKDGTTYYISRISAQFDRNKGLVSMKAEEAEIQWLIRALSKALGRTIICDSLPRAQISVNMENIPPEKALEIILRRFPDYKIETDNSYYYVRLAPRDQNGSKGVVSAKKTDIVRNGDLYSIDLEKDHSLSVIASLFASAGKEYSLLSRADVELSDLYFSGRDFDSLLRLVLEQAGCDYTVNGNIYYIYEIQKRDVLKGLKPVSTMQLVWIRAEDALALLPGELGANQAVKIDKESNSIIMAGGQTETGPVFDFLKKIDQPLMGRSYMRFDLKYQKAKDIIPLVPSRLLQSSPYITPDGNSFVCLMAPDGAGPLSAYLLLLDKKNESIPIKLNYIKSEDLLKHLPPSVSKDDILESGDPSIVFFTGSEEKRRLFMREKDLVDRPRPQIRYEVLVIQHQKGDGAKWSENISASAAAGSESLIAGLGSLLSLNFDAVSQFGLLYSVQLSLELSNSLAYIFADTSLCALSGQDVKFQNTSTYRYAEASWDSDKKKYIYSGATREITSGLILGINGWVSGDNMITMTVSSTISKQGQSDSSDTAVLPPTTEKVVSTQVRTPSGIPVVISGLRERDKSVTIKKVPLLGDIPLIGYLFTSRTVTDEETCFDIYIVPHVSYGLPEDAALPGIKMEKYYNTFVLPRVKEAAN